MVLTYLHFGILKFPGTKSLLCLGLLPASKTTNQTIAPQSLKFCSLKSSKHPKKDILWMGQRNSAPPKGWLKAYKEWDNPAIGAGFRWPIHSVHSNFLFSPRFSSYEPLKRFVLHDFSPPRYPDDLDDESVLIPVDVTGEECPTSYEDLIEKASFPVHHQPMGFKGSTRGDFTMKNEDFPANMGGLHHQN